MANAAAAAINLVAGVNASATVAVRPDGVYVVTPAPSQIAPLRAIVAKASSGKPSMNVDLTAVLYPVIVKKALPWAALAMGVAFLAGRISK